ncbi:hypothetical protein SODG_000449 [Sodalis praecaptivus]
MTCSKAISPLTRSTSTVPSSFSVSISRMENSVWQAAIPRWNWALTLVRDFSGRIRAIIDENTTVIVPAVKFSITDGKLAAYRTKASAREAINWISGSETEEAATIFIPCWRMRLLTLLKRSFSTFWPQKSALPYAL